MRERSDVMIDLETLSTKANAAVVAIGAVEFDIESGSIFGAFERRVDVASACKGRNVSVDTCVWWLSQSPEAISETFSKEDAVTTKEMLEEFAEWFTLVQDECETPVCVWGNGSSFDITIMETLFQQYDMRIPWKYSAVRDVRTLVDANNLDKGSIAFKGTKHNALADAIHQVEYVCKCWQELRYAK